MKHLKKLSVLIFLSCLLILLISGCNRKDFIDTKDEITFVDENSELYKFIQSTYSNQTYGGILFNPERAEWADILSKQRNSTNKSFFADFTILEETDYKCQVVDNYTIIVDEHFFKARIDKVYGTISSIKVGDEVILNQMIFTDDKTKERYIHFTDGVIFVPGLKFTSRVLLTSALLQDGNELKYYRPSVSSRSYPVTIDGIEYLYFKNTTVQAYEDTSTYDELFDLYKTREISLLQSDYQYITEDGLICPIVKKDKFEELVKDSYRNPISYDRWES